MFKATPPDEPSGDGQGSLAFFSVGKDCSRLDSPGDSMDSQAFLSKTSYFFAGKRFDVGSFSVKRFDVGSSSPDEKSEAPGNR